MELDISLPLWMTIHEILGLIWICGVLTGLQTKTQVYTAIDFFSNMVETQFKTKVAVVRTDNGSEFIQSSCLGLFVAKGILHQRSIVKTP